MFEKSKTPSFYPETTIFCVENPRNTQVLLAVFSLNLTVSGQKSVISSIFKQALEKEKIKKASKKLKQKKKIPFPQSKSERVSAHKSFVHFFKSGGG
ncbi:hypothetical protein [Acutalibacter caecimuris]|uniref:hypothetical protein n=1 Tax=Acutalibacter caecimuris TaxID=3093657 RepID=UPI002AC9AB8F|nr:hypothetical protein [Acutalibacter sp. M00118]